MNTFLKNSRTGLFLILNLTCAAFSLRAETSILADLLKASEAVVHIEAENTNQGIIKSQSTAPRIVSGYATRQGTGILIDHSGVIVTNAHVVSHAEQIHVSTARGNRYNAKPLVLDTANDLCLLKIEAAQDFPFLRLADASAVTLQSKVYSIGGSALLKNTLSEGKVTGFAFSKQLKQIPFFKRKAKDIKLFQINMDLYPGDSGSPIFNSSGEVIGIISSAAQKKGKTTFVVPSNLIRAYLTQAMASAKQTGR